MKTNFFRKFPVISFDLQKNGINTALTDIYRYAALREAIVIDEDITSYLNVNIEDGERPDILSYRIYGSIEYYWTFFILNAKLLSGSGLRWKLSSIELEKYKDEKYGPFSVLEILPVYGTGEVTQSTIDGTIRPPRIVAAASNMLSGLPLNWLSRGEVLDVSRNVIDTVEIHSYDSNRSQLWIDHVSRDDFDKVVLKIRDDLNEEDSFVAVKEILEYIRGINEPRFWNIFEQMSNAGLFTDIVNDPIETFAISASATISFFNSRNILEFTARRVFRDSSSAPYSFLQNDRETLSILNSDSAFFKSYNTSEDEINEELATIRIVRPDRIRQFVNTYFDTINDRN